MKRRGTSLMEVLIAIFVLALGLVSLLTLFPIGFVQMAKAVQDERAAQLAGNAASYMRMYWKSMCEEAVAMARNGESIFRFDPNIPAVYTGTTPPAMLQELRLWFPYAMDDPNCGIAQPALALTLPGTPLAALTDPTKQFNNSLLASAQERPSYPVYVDPVGWRAADGKNGIQGLWVGAGNPSAPAVPVVSPTPCAIPRRTIGVDSWRVSHTIATEPAAAPKFRTMREMATPQILRTCFLMDDGDFDTDGKMNMFTRLPQYSCAWLLRRDRNSHRKDVNMTVVIYHRRAVESPTEETAYWASPTVTRLPDNSMTYGNTLRLHYSTTTNDKPAIRRGTWILDATVSPTAMQGFYYRVTDVSEPQQIGSEFVVDVQLESPLRPGLEVPETPASYQKSRKFVIQDRVLEVFDKGTLELNSLSRIN